jgi:hypothetical protein
MEQKQDDKSKWVELGIKMALSLAALFPLYALLYITFPASIVAFYLISAVVLCVFAPWENWKKRFLS